MTNQSLPKLTYTGASKSAVPIISESELQTVTAEPWLKISDEGLQLEGLIFDRDHNLFLCEVFGGKIFKVDIDTKRGLNSVSINKTKSSCSQNT